MTPQRLIDQTHHYHERLSGLLIPKDRIDIDTAFGDHTVDEILAHAHHLCEGIPTFAPNPEQWGKANRHYGSLQTLLSVAKMHTLRELMEQNKPA